MPEPSTLPAYLVVSLVASGIHVPFIGPGTDLPRLDACSLSPLLLRAWQKQGKSR
jgi:hypothetical protein